MQTQQSDFHAAHGFDRFITSGSELKLIEEKLKRSVPLNACHNLEIIFKLNAKTNGSAFSVSG
jgi:hypothetical protein